MKRAVSVILFIIIMALTLSSCHPTSFSLTESEIEKLYAEDTSSTDIDYPSSEEITGVYLVTSRDSTDEFPYYNAFLRKIDGKYILQVVSTNTTLKELTDDMKDGITSLYQEEDGHFQQKFSSDEYISSYDVYLYKEKDGRIKIIIHKQYIEIGYNPQNVTCEGYKTGEIENIPSETDDTDTSTQEEEVN